MGGFREALYEMVLYVPSHIIFSFYFRDADWWPRAKKYAIFGAFSSYIWSPPCAVEVMKRGAYNAIFVLIGKREMYARLHWRFIWQEKKRVRLPNARGSSLKSLVRDYCAAVLRCETSTPICQYTCVLIYCAHFNMKEMCLCIRSKCLSDSRDVYCVY